MKNRSLIFAVLMLFCLTHPRPGRSEPLKAVLKEAMRKGTFLPAEKEELTKAEALFAQMFSGIPERDTPGFSALQAAWEKLDAKLELLEAGRKVFCVVREKRKTGRGIYIFPVRSGGEILLQMPHSFKDLYTREIGRKLFLEGRFTAAAWNTVPRYFTKDGKEVAADMSDLTDTWFAVFTRAFAGRYPDGHVIQLHGFLREKRTRESGASSDMIISHGDLRPPPWLREMDRCLEDRFSLQIRRFPEETGELGATQTSIGRVLRQMGHSGFLHMEMNRAVRKKFRDEAASRRKLLECLGEVLVW